MKKTVFLVAFFILIKPVFPVLEYAFNYEYVSKVLCENKDNPKMHCNGKCHLMKELAKASENEKPLSSDKKTAFQEHEVLFFQEVEAYQIFDVYFQKAKKVNAAYSNLYFHGNTNPVFRPPTRIS